MRKLCPNLDRDDSLDTVLEVPIPDEMLINAPGTDKRRGAGGANMRAWLKAQAFDRATVDGAAPPAPSSSSSSTSSDRRSFPAPCHTTARSADPSATPPL